MSQDSYDALLLVSFGGPEGPDEVMPFLENVLRGKRVPRARMLEVAEHYQHFGGVSPINAQCRELIAALRSELDRHGINLPIYWGNRNWQPFLSDALAEMAQTGVKRALAWITSTFSSYSGCRQYRENIADAQQAVGASAPQVDKLRFCYNHPEFIAANADRVRDALHRLPEERRGAAPVLFSAHSIPLSMSENCDYVQQLSESCRLVAEQLRIEPDRWRLVYQSRSGRPQDPWLEPDVVAALGARREGGAADAIVVPIGFVSDHMEVLYDLDYEARRACEEMGLNLVRAATVGVHPRFVTMIRELIQEQLDETVARRAIGRFGPHHDVCPPDCCRYEIRRPPPVESAG